MFVYELSGRGFEFCCSSLKIEQFEKKGTHVNKLVRKTEFNTKVGKIENKKPKVRRLVANNAFNTKIEEVEINH